MWRVMEIPLAALIQICTKRARPVGTNQMTTKTVSFKSMRKAVVEIVILLMNLSDIN